MGGRDHLSAFKVQGGDSNLFVIIVGGLIAIVLLIILYRVLKSYYIKFSTARQERERFNRVCAKRRLTGAEIDFLQELIQKYQLSRPVVLVRNIQVFDKYMAREVARYRNKETQQKERFKIFVFELRRKLGFANFENLEELTSTRQIQEGLRTKVTVEIASLEKIFDGKIAKVDEEEIMITVPEHFMSEEPLRANQSVSFTVTHLEDAEYTFKSVIYRVIPGPPGYIAAEHSRTFTRAQKRKYPRLNCEIPFRYFILNRLQEKEFNERRIVQVTSTTLYQEDTILNISGGGCYFHTTAEFEVGNLMWLAFQIDNSGTELKDIVGHVERITDIENGEYRIVLHFSKIMDAHRDKIVRYIHAKKTEEKETPKVKIP